MNLSTQVEELSGVGAQTAKKLKLLGLSTAQDVIENFPRRYEDFSKITPINSIVLGPVTVKGKILQSKGRYARRGMHVTEAVLSDKTGSVRLVWFNQPYRADGFKDGKEYFVSGEFSFKSKRLSIINPSVELVSNFPLNTARIIPIYKQVKGLKSHIIRKIVKQVFKKIPASVEILPTWVVHEQNLLTRSEALKKIHFPDKSEDILEAKKRLGFDEVFTLALAGLLNKQEFAKGHAMKIEFREDIAKKFTASLPFKLTDDQRKTAWRILQDLGATKPMNMLVEGDVGSGKTVVAVMAAAMAMSQGFQVAFMAPTEILARQHAQTLKNLLKGVGQDDSVALLVGGMNAKDRKTSLELAKTKKAVLLVGTHALIQEKVNFHNLGLAIIDEQHRFGVEQRKALQKKAKHTVHTLSLTATPIPRSLALTLYGELDISLLKQKPKKRQTVSTKLVPQSSRTKLIEAVTNEIEKKRQAFWVCPLIEPSEVEFSSKSVEEVYAQLSKKEFKKYKVGLLHGNLKAEDKERIMQQFSQGHIDLLVTTTVIEVGVDVPNATVMVIESPERFGLAQLHQLRGRVGRSEHKSYCYLQLQDAAGSTNRLRMLSTSNDGFKLAEYDMELRGPGAVYGTSQHGALDLRIANLSDHRLIAAAREMAERFIAKAEDLVKYPQLKKLVDDKRSVTNLN